VFRFRREVGQKQTQKRRARSGACARIRIRWLAFITWLTGLVSQVTEPRKPGHPIHTLTLAPIDGTERNGTQAEEKRIYLSDPLSLCACSGVPRAAADKATAAVAISNSPARTSPLTERGRMRRPTVKSDGRPAAALQLERASAVAFRFRRRVPHCGWISDHVVADQDRTCGVPALRCVALGGRASASASPDPQWRNFGPDRNERCRLCLGQGWSR
jgi:hypothetical protein